MPEPAPQPERVHTDAWLAIFKKQKHMAEQAVAQLSNEQLYARPAPGVNSIAIIMNHVAGNLASRWTDFLTTDGEKPTRDREREFTDVPAARADLTARWNRGWAILLKSIAALTPADLARTVTIRSEPHTVPGAVCRAIDHNGYHVGQIVTFARMLVGNDKWRWLTVEPGGSEQFNRAKAAQFRSKP